MLKTTVAYVILATILIVALTRLLPLAEGLYLNPIEVTKVTKVMDTSQYSDILIVGVKARDCRLVTAGVKVRTNNAWIAGTMMMVKEDGSKLSLDDQRIAIGTPFIRTLRVTPAGDDIRMYATWKCHPYWDTTSHVASLP